MFTVIFLNERTSEQIRDYQFLFHPLLEQGTIAFCNWNPGGTDLSSSIPELYPIIRGKKCWRAVILNTDSLYETSTTLNTQNPFDFSAQDAEILPHESPIPLIRLTHILGGYPIQSTHDFAPGYEYFDDETGKLERIPSSSLSSDELDILMERFGSLKHVYIEKEISQELQQTCDIIEEKYRFSETRPDEIILIATRLKSDKNEKNRLFAACRPYLETSSSNFWQINHYPNACRFLFSDISRSDCSLYQQEIIRFWLSVLTISFNELPPDVLQAYRLYHLDIDVNSDILGRNLAIHKDQLKAATKFVQEQIDKLSEFSLKKDEPILIPENIPIVIEDTDDTQDYEADSCDELQENTPNPVDGIGSYDADIQAKKDNILNDIKNPRRSIDRAARTLKSKTHTFIGESYELEQFQLHDLNENLNQIELRLFQERPCNDFKEKKQVLIQTIQETNQALENIPKSMSLSVELKAGAAALAIAFIGNVTYLIDAWTLGKDIFLQGIILTLIILFITALGGYCALLILKPKMKENINTAINPIRRVKDEILNSNAKFENYFSDVCTFMKGRAIVAGTSLCEESSSSEKARLTHHKTAIQSALQRNAIWENSFSLNSDAYSDEPFSGHFNTDISPLSNALYDFCTCDTPQNVSLNDSGDTILSPYEFIQKLIIEREEIFDVTR